MGRNQLAIFSPLPPTRSGIADYCLEQLPYLARDWDITVVTAEPHDQIGDLPEGVQSMQIQDWLADEERDLAVPRIYHLGNNPHHEFVFEQILLRPGVVVLHDFVLHHLITELTLARGDEERYREFLEHDFGELGTEVAEQRARFAFTDYQQFLMPLNGRVLSAASGVIVHSRWSERRVRSARPELDVAYIPHHFSPPAPEWLAGSRKAARKRLGMPEDKLIFVALGFVTEPKRIDMAVAALGRIQADIPDFEFWIVGEAQDPKQLNAWGQEHGIADRIKLMGYVETEDFYLAIEATDVLINLRYPTAGETSGTLVRTLGMGRPVVAFNYASFADIPSDCAMKLPLDTTCSKALSNCLQSLATQPQLRERLERNAKEHARTHFAIDRCAQAYSDFAKACLLPEQSPLSQQI